MEKLLALEKKIRKYGEKIKKIKALIEESDENKKLDIKITKDKLIKIGFPSDSKLLNKITDVKLIGKIEPYTYYLEESCDMCRCYLFSYRIYFEKFGIEISMDGGDYDEKGCDCYKGYITLFLDKENMNLKDDWSFGECYDNNRIYMLQEISYDGFTNHDHNVDLMKEKIYDGITDESNELDDIFEFINNHTVGYLFFGKHINKMTPSEKLNYKYDIKHD